MAQTSRTRRARSKPPTLKTTNPATGAPLEEIQANTPGEVADIVAAARKVAPEWAAIPAEGRARIMSQVRHRIYSLLDDLVTTISLECGKPPAEALAHDVLPSVLTLQYYERMAPRWLRPERPGKIIGPVLGLSSRVDFRPFGVVGVISPWNYPLLLSTMGLAPALFAGNTVVVKPSEVTPGTGRLLREILDPLPAGVASVVLGAGDVGAALVDAPVDKICFIGSPGTGRAIGEAAAKHLTPVVMELGGQDAAIVCDDADLDVATSGVLWGSFLNAGQTCAAIERAYVAESIADRFEAQLVSKLEKLRQGSDGDVGPLTAPRQLEIVRRHLSDAVSKGARVLAGGAEAGRSNSEGTLWHAPTVIEGRGEDMSIYSEETFGPLLPVVRVRDDDEAVRRVNEEGFNLTTSVWTTDNARATRIASRLRAGTVVINAHAETAGAPWTPWGGVGESGYGRLNGIYGLREFTVPVNVARSTTPRLKRVWWYPYGEATTATLRGFTELLSAPRLEDKRRALKSIAENFGQALKEKL